MHEDFTREHEVRIGSDRSFGLTVGVAFLALGLLPLVRHRSPRVLPLAVAAVLLLLAVVRPAVLKTFNRGWSKLGLLLNRVTSPVLMAGVFFFAVAPMGLIMRALGRDLLRLRRDPQRPSYWIHRTSPPGSMRQQF